MASKQIQAAELTLGHLAGLLEALVDELLLHVLQAGAALHREREVALEQPAIELLTECLDDEHHVDVVGQIGFDPTFEWGTGNTSTADNTIRRKPLVRSVQVVCAGCRIKGV